MTSRETQHRSSRSRSGGVPAARGAMSSGLVAGGLVASGALAAGALAIGAVAIGAFAIGRLSVRRATFGTLEIDELVVRSIRRPRRDAQDGDAAPEPTGP